MEENDLTHPLARRLSKSLEFLGGIENTRIHGFVLMLIGFVASGFILFLMVAFEFLGFNISESSVPRGERPPPAPSIILLFVGLATVPIIGFGAVEFLTGTKWSQAKGIISFLILALVCIPLLAAFFVGSFALMGRVRSSR